MIRIAAISLLVGVIQHSVCSSDFAGFERSGSSTLRIEDKFPAEFRVVSHRIDGRGRHLIRGRLLIEEDVAIYANSVSHPWKTRELLVSVHKDGKPVGATIRYPMRQKKDVAPFGILYLYRGTADVIIVIPERVSLPLELRCRVGGYNERRAYCLGEEHFKVTLEAPLQQ